MVGAVNADRPAAAVEHGRRPKCSARRLRELRRGGGVAARNGNAGRKEHRDECAAHKCRHAPAGELSACAGYGLQTGKRSACEPHAAQNGERSRGAPGSRPLRGRRRRALRGPRQR